MFSQFSALKTIFAHSSARIIVHCCHVMQIIFNHVELCRQHTVATLCETVENSNINLIYFASNYYFGVFKM